MNSMRDRATTLISDAWSVAALCTLVAVVCLSLRGRSPGLDQTLIIGLVNLIMVIGLSVFVGNSGVVSFGHLSFTAIGAYVCGMFTIPDIAKPVIMPNAPAIFQDHTLGTAATVLVGGAVAAAVGLIVSFPLMRLSGIGASIGTLALLLIVNTFFSNWKPGTSGGGNLTRIPTDTNVNLMVGWAVLALVVAFLFQRSRFGLRLRASREDEVAAPSVGINVAMERRFAFTLSALLFGVAGGLHGHSIGSFAADDFYLQLTFLTLAMLVLGGQRSLAGAVAGTGVLTLVSYIFGQWQNGEAFLGIAIKTPAGSRHLVIALVMISVLLMRPDGLTKGKEIPPLRRLLDRFTRSARKSAKEPVAAS